MNLPPHARKLQFSLQSFKQIPVHPSGRGYAAHSLHSANPCSFSTRLNCFAPSASHFHIIRDYSISRKNFRTTPLKPLPHTWPSLSFTRAINTNTNTKTAGSFFFIRNVRIYLIYLFLYVISFVPIIIAIINFSFSPSNLNIKTLLTRSFFKKIGLF